jgi:hypothetical protein
VPEIVLMLQGEPELGRGAREPGKTGSHARSNAGRPGENPVEGLAGDVEIPGSLTD